MEINIQSTKVNTMTEKKSTLQKLRENASLIVSAIAILAVVSQAFTLPKRVETLENQIVARHRIVQLEDEVKVLRNTVTDIHARVMTIERQTGQLHTYFLEKGLDSKND